MMTILPIFLLLTVSLLYSTSLSAAKEFPILEFYGWKSLPESVALHSLLCHPEQSSVMPAEIAKVCECHSKCMKFKTCCIDYLWNTKAVNSLESVSDYTEQFLEESGKYPDLECNPVTIGLPDTFQAERILMRSECRDDATKFEKESCYAFEIPSDVRPVLGRDGIVYKNGYCAKCNDVNEFKRLQLEAKNCIPSAQKNATRFMDRYKGCTIALKMLNETEERNSIRSCSSAINAIHLPPLPTDDSDLNFKLCNSYKSGFMVGDNYDCYDNPTCYEVITGDKLNLKDIKLTCRHNLPTIRETSRSISFNSFNSYSVLVSFEDLHRNEDENQCPPNMIYDTQVETCVGEFACGFGFKRIGDSCFREQIAPPRFDHGESKTGSLTQEQIMNRCLSTTVNAIVSLDDQDNIDEIITTNKDVIIEILRNTSKNVVFRFNRNHLSNITTLFPPHQKIQIIESTTAQHYLPTFYGTDFKRTFSAGRICAKLNNNPLSYNLSSNCWLMTGTRNIPSTQYVLNRITDGEGGNRFAQISTCQQFHLDSPCTKRIISNFTKYNNGSVFDQEFNMILNAGQYVPLDGMNSGTVGTCLQTATSATTTKTLKGWERVTYGIEKYITIVGCFASVIGYLWMIFTYTIIPALKTIPGQNIVCLCTMLLCSDIVILATLLDLSYSVCAAFGMLLHLFALSAQVWAGILAFDIWSTFHGRGQLRKASGKNRFRIYLSVGYVIPFVFVLVCVIMEMKKVVEFGYGINGVCWIAFFTPRLFIYILPMVCITLFNVSVLSYTIFSICKQSRKSKKLLKKTGGKDVSLARMALKLVVLIGAIELLGLIQIKGAGSDQSKILNSIFRIVYSIARSFRGVFIWLLYIVTDQVFSVYRDIRSQGSLRTRSSYASSSMASSTRRRSEVNQQQNQVTSKVGNGSSSSAEETDNLMVPQPAHV